MYSYHRASGLPLITDSNDEETRCGRGERVNQIWSEWERELSWIWSERGMGWGRSKQCKGGCCVCERVCTCACVDVWEGEKTGWEKFHIFTACGRITKLDLYGWRALTLYLSDDLIVLWLGSFCMRESGWVEGGREGMSVQRRREGGGTCSHLLSVSGK